MDKRRKDFQDIFDELSILALSDKIIFLERLLFNFTITGRGIKQEDSNNAFINSWEYNRIRTCPKVFRINLITHLIYWIEILVELKNPSKSKI